MRSVIIAASLILSAQAADAGTLRTADGVRLHYEVLSRGRAVVIYVHGGPGSNFRGQEQAMRAAARGRALVVYDQRGSGLSSVITDGGRLTLAEHVRDLETVRRRLRASRVSIIALSWGAAIATTYAAEYPQHVSRVILISPLSPTRAAFDERLRALATITPPEARDRLQALRRRMPSAAEDEVLGICREAIALTIGRQYLASPTPEKIEQAQRRCDIPPPAIRNRPLVEAAGVQSLGNWDLRPVMRRVRVPVLVFEGAQSHVPLSATETWAKTLPNGRFLLIGGAGHEVFLDQPDAFAGAARSFLGGRWPAGSLRLRD